MQKNDLNFLLPLLILIVFSALKVHAQVGYFDAPYTRYEADDGTLVNASATTKSYIQSDLQSEASEQICVNLSASGAMVSWTVIADGDGLVVRYSVPDGQSGVLEVFANNVSVGTLNLTSYYSWEYLSSNGNPNNVGVVNTNPKMRFDEVRMKLPSKILSGGNLRLARVSGNIHIDFAELESIPPAVASSGGNVIYGGNGSDLQNVIDANGGATIYLPAGVYNVGRDLYFGVANTVLKGAGMWYTQIHFTSGAQDDGGLWANANNISYSGLYLTTVRNSRSSSYKAINGVYTAGSTITNVWAEHFECGAWIAQYNTGPAVADGFTMSNCRFRDNYADGTNLCKGTRNAIVEHCSYRNNGDDDMAIWSANNQECQNNTFRYNTSENCWRASGCAIYGGLNNKAHNLLIRDNVEVGLRVNNAFGGAPFNGGGLHEFYNILIYRCGTYNDLYNTAVGAIDIACTNIAGTRINNVRFSCIEIIDSKNDAIYINRKSGEGFYNLSFENITINGTGREYPNNGAGTSNGGIRGYGLLFWGSPSGNGTYCNMSYSNRGGNAGSDVNTSQLGSMSWNPAGTCPGGCSLASANTVITSANTFGVCTSPITLTATSTPPSGNTVSFVEFFVDAVSIGQDNSSAYSMSWNNPTVGSHTIQAVSHYSGGSTSSASQTVTVTPGVYTIASPPSIDGTIDASWGAFPTNSLGIVSVGTVTNAADLSATFQLARDATNLYILMNVTDDDLRNDGGNGYDNDGEEIFIDMGNDKAGAYGANDFAYMFLINDATVYESKHTATGGVNFAQGAKAGGYILEIQIPWATLGGAPAAGSFMGLDVHVNDDDGGGTRDGKKAWKDATDNAWQWPSVLGTVQVANCSNPLPVEWLSFSGTYRNDFVVLEWATISEINNDYFEVEKSYDGTTWNELGRVGAKGSLVTYTYSDSEILSQQAYYRLKQVDLDGQHSYSAAIVITLPSEKIVLIQNPIEEKLTFRSSEKGMLELKFYNALGVLVYSKQCLPEFEWVEMNLSLPAGAYTVYFIGEYFMENKRVLKN